ncbi:transport and Golgi organization protein 6 homolog [Lytechinus pictus]|uniref:transport and Golgi organization protein 6 homolog n=1 Tax=Lytechinus pictus TaxID=7653 RepID=UPI0030B9D025
MAAPMDFYLRLLRELFKGISILTSPSSEPPETQEDSSRNDLLEGSLTKSMEALHNALDGNSDLKNPTAIFRDNQASLRSKLQQVTDKKWVYVEHCLAMLESLRCCYQDALQTYEEEQRKIEGAPTIPLTPNMAPTASPDTLSFNQQAALSSLTQFIISLGICPALLKGVGLPLNVRSRLAASFMPTDKPLPFKERQRRLMVILKIFSDCIKQPVLGGFILSKNLNDVLASLIQVVCTMEIQKTIKIKKPDGSLVSPAEREPALPPSDITFAKAQLEHLTRHCYQPSVIKELLILQGGMGSGVKGQSTLPKPPLWFRKMCGHLLAERIMTEKGVAHFLQGLVDDGDTSSGSWARCDALANLLATPPSTAVSKKAYFKSICHQILDVLHSGDDIMMRQIIRVISSSVVVILTNEKVIAEQYILDPLFKALKADKDAKGSSQLILTSEAELSQCISDIYRMFIIGREPSPLLLLCLTPILHHLFSLYAFSMEGVCNLRATVEEILCAYLRTSDHSTALHAMEHISAIRAHTMYDTMNEKVTFRPGSGGGAIMVYQGDSSLEELFTQTLMSHEHIGRCCTALLLKVSQEKLSADFFISVLNEMTAAVASLDSSSSEQRDPPSGRSGHSSELLDLEPSSQPDRINTVQHALRVLAVLEQLCEAFGPDVLKDTHHLLQFCQASLQRCVDRLKQEGEDGTDIPGVLETETLTLAVTLLSAIITGEQKKKLESTDRKILQDILPLLMTIAKLHSLETIQEMADGLAIAIATHGAVSSSSIHHAGKDVRKGGKRNEQSKVNTTMDNTNGVPGRPKAETSVESDVAAGSCIQSSKDVNRISRETSTSNDIGKPLLHRLNTEEKEEAMRQTRGMDIPGKSTNQNQDALSARNPSLGICENVSRRQEPCQQADNPGADGDLIVHYEQSALHDKNSTDLEISKNNRSADTESRVSDLDNSKSQIPVILNDPTIHQQDRKDEDSVQQEKPTSEAFDEAIRDLTDPLLPVRGHGLIMLTRLLKEKDPRAIAESETLLAIFEEHLSDDDTYIYLPCINGLVALAASHPDRVMPHLCSNFTSGHASDQSRQWSATSRTVSLEKTLKMGEALVRATRELGELVPHYRGLLLNTIMAATRHSDAHIRASSLAHLGEVCGLLKYSLGAVIHEVLNCVTSALKSDPEPEVKRSAVQVMNLLLRGLGKDAIQVLDTSIRDVYRCLKHVRDVEKDDVLLLHTQLAMEELDIIMRQYLFPKQTLSKKITVLNP